MAWKEFEELKAENERLTMLQSEAEKYAYQVRLKLLVYVDLYSAFLRKAPQMRSDMDHTVLPSNYTMPAFTPEPQNITALWLVLILPSHEGKKAESTWVVGYISK